MQERQAWEALARWELAPDARILDVGCGDGRITAELARRVPEGRVLGVDLSPEMIEHARRHAPTERANLAFQVMSADALDLSERFTHVVSFSCLHWVRDQAAVWEGFRRCLESDGHVLVGFQTDHENLWPTVEELIASPAWREDFAGFQDPYNHFTLAALRTFAEDAGFHVPRADDILAVEPFGDRDGLGAFLGSWLPQVAHLPEARREPFLDQLLDRYLARVEEPIGAAAGIRIRRLVLEAEKR